MWSKLDDGFYDHPKILAAGNEATGLFCRSLSYTAKHLTDRFIPADVAKLLGRSHAITRLVDAGLWEAAEGGFRIHNYLTYNRSRSDVEQERAAARERMRRGRQ